MTKAFVEMSNAREDEQRKVMERIKEKGVCPFCPEGEPETQMTPILKDGHWWTVRKNRWPLPSTTLHLLFVSKKHAEKLNDLYPGAALELMELFLWAETEFKLEHGALAMRFGEPGLNGATVRHLHAHIIVADPNTEKAEYKDVRFRMGPKSKKNSP